MTSLRRIEKGYQGMVDAQDRLIAWANDASILKQRSTRVSEWRVGLHVVHLGKTADVILEALQRFLQAGGESGVGGPNFIGRLVLLSRFIPRGKAEVPDFLTPDQIDAAELIDRLQTTRRGILQLGDHLPELATLHGTQPHPLLGHFTVRQWIDFLVIHHHHHFKIIRDIEKDLARR